jgi:hypothetical protein
VISDWFVADQAKLLWLTDELVTLDLPDSECILVFVYNRLLAPLTTNDIFLTVNHRVIIREELPQGLFNVLDSLVVHVEHLMWYLLIVQAIFYCRLTGIFGNVVLLLNHCILTEELDPVLEGWQDSIGRSPFLETMWLV